MDLDLTMLSVTELLGLHRRSLVELHRRGIVRTLNAPQGDWAELLVSYAYGGTLVANSAKGHDVTTPSGDRLQVKARVLDHRKVGSNITSPFRSWDFEYVVVVLLSPDDLSVGRAAELPVDIARQKATHRPHVNGHVLHPTPALMDLGRDVTDLLRKAADDLPPMFGS